MTLIVALFGIFLLIVFVFCIAWVDGQLEKEGFPGVKTKTPMPLCESRVIVRGRGRFCIKPQEFSRKPIFPPPAPKPKARAEGT